MSTRAFLDRLLDGAEVVWRPLGEVATLQKGTSITQKNIIFGDIPVIAGGQKPAYFYNQYNRSGEMIVIAGSGAYAGFVSYWDKPIFVSDAFSIKPKSDFLLAKYCFYWLQNIQSDLYQLQRGGGVPHVYARDVALLKIPLPCSENPAKSLAIQTQIVRILDKFTELTTELNKELALRKQQYAFYRHQLLEFPQDKVTWKCLGDIGNVKMCKRIFKNETQDDGEIPFYKIGTFGKQADAFISRKLYLSYKDKYSFPQKGDVLISASGTIGRTVVYDGRPAYFQDSNIVWLDNDESLVSNQYLNHCYKIAKWFVSDGGTIDRLYNENILKTTIPVPYADHLKKSLAEQERIVMILDKFETLTNSLQEGLPREIELRQTQYEYYRDRLFDFPRA